MLCCGPITPTSISVLFVALVFLIPLLRGVIVSRALSAVVVLSSSVALILLVVPAAIVIVMTVSVVPLTGAAALRVVALRLVLPGLPLSFLRYLQDI